jgi:hypothetical protein
MRTPHRTWAIGMIQISDILAVASVSCYLLPPVISSQVCWAVAMSLDAAASVLLSHPCSFSAAKILNVMGKDAWSPRIPMGLRACEGLGSEARNAPSPSWKQPHSSRATCTCHMSQTLPVSINATTRPSNTFHLNSSISTLRASVR